MKDPVKLARKELPKLGATIIRDANGMIEFQLPTGGRYFVSSGSKLPKLRALIESLTERYNPLSGYVVVDEFPNVSATTATPHFRHRFELMEDQEQLTGVEVADALARPVRVWRSGDRFAYERGRVVVVGQTSKGVLVLITVLWATQDLWERNPRPEVVSVGSQ